MIIKYGITGILLFLLTILSVNMSVAQSGLDKIKCVCIDAGHGGRDPGAVGAKTYEKHIVLSVALKLGKLIETAYPDVKVVYIRDKDNIVELTDRSRIANKHKADLFISVHANSLDVKAKPSNKYVTGVETYVMGLNGTEHNLQVAMKENSAIHYEDDYSVKYDGFDPTRPESYILFNLLRNLYFDKSLMLASMVQEELVKSTQQKNRGVAQGPIWVLKDVSMPAVLVEIGYISNLQEERFMMSAAGQDKIARGIFKGFQAYKRKVEKSVILPEEQVAEKKVPEKKIVSVQEDGANPVVPIYAIQVASAITKIKNSAALCKGEQVCELNSGGRYRYYVAPSAQLETVQGRLKEVRKKVKDCFVIAIYKGKLISVAEARKLEQKKR